jgi:carboxymethylenebutenolidase
MVNEKIILNPMTSKDINLVKNNRDVINLYDQYAHGKISKREFLDRVQKFVLGISAVTILEILSPKYSYANQVDPNDKSLQISTISYPSPKGHGNIKSYVAKPITSNEKTPVILLVHENRGLNPYITDVARRLAKENFIAFAPDGLSAKGGYPGNDDQGREMQASLDQEKLKQDFFAGIEYLEKNYKSKIGTIGFCYGGGMVNQLVVNFKNISAAVSYYGPQADLNDVPKIQSPLMLHYAELDERINKGWPDFEKALKDKKKNYVIHSYNGVNHAFHNDTTSRYDKAAAELSWQRSMDFFKKYLV